MLSRAHIICDVFRLGTIFSDGMVLQRTVYAYRNIYPRIWGVGPPGSEVEVKIIGDSVIYDTFGISVLADGTWSVTLQVTKAFVGTGFTLEANNTRTEVESSVSLSGVAFGEVWVCSV